MKTSSKQSKHRDLHPRFGWSRGGGGGGGWWGGGGETKGGGGGGVGYFGW